MAKVTLNQNDIDNFSEDQRILFREQLGVNKILPGTYFYGADNDDIFTADKKEPSGILRYEDNPGIKPVFVSSKNTDSFIDKNNALRPGERTTFGSSATNPYMDFNALGSFGKFMKPAMMIMDQAYSSVDREPTQREKNINLGRNALQFFTNLSIASSQPGATLVGAGVQAGAKVAQDYLDRTLKKEQDDKKLEQAKKTGAISLGMQLFTADNKLKQLQAKPKTFKGASRGDLVRYMSKEDAEKYFLNYGMKRDNPNFDDAVSKLLAPRPELIGQYIKDDTGKQLELLPVYKGDQIVRFNLSAQTGAEPGLDFKGKTKRIENINLKILPNLTKARVDLLPKAELAMQLLMGGEQTGRYLSALKSFKEFYAGFFNLGTKDLEGMQLLESISNQLAPGMREAGSGPMSDKDLEVFKSAILTLDNTPYANYISLYTFSRAKQNMIKMITAEQEMLQSPNKFSQADINKRLEEIDTGIYRRFVNKKDGERLYDDEIEDENGLTEEDRAVQAWEKTLKKGDVVLNRDDFGNELYQGKRTLIVIGGPF